MSNLVKRVLVAVIAIPIVIYISFKPYSLLGLTIIVALLAVHEFYGLMKAKGFSPQIILGMLLTTCIVLTFAHFRLPIKPTTELLPLILILGVVTIFMAELVKGYPNPSIQVAATLAGALYIGAGLGGVYGIHEYFYVHGAQNPSLVDPALVSVEAGYFLVAMLASIWICDSAAYFIGRAFGKHKIAKSISPNKSWEGGIAGLVTAIGAWLLARVYIGGLEEVSLSTAIAMGIIAGGFGQVGDFAESMLKRDAGVKDSSTLIPGHGGVLDRIDSILFVAPLAYVYLQIFGL
jgi:phosphatidate cytidylyltransferase